MIYFMTKNIIFRQHVYLPSLMSIVTKRFNLIFFLNVNLDITFSLQLNGSNEISVARISLARNRWKTLENWAWRAQR